MSIKATLKGYFQTGLRPTQTQFEDVIDSLASIVETNNATLTLGGGIVIGNTPAVPAVPGAIRWTGANFEFHNGAGFQPITLGGGISNPQDIGNVRIGSTLTGGVAALAHQSKYNDNDFGFGQTPSGTTIVSSGTSIIFQNRAANVPTNVLTIAGNKATVNTTLTVNTQLIVGPALPAAALPIPAGVVLAVNGDAQKWTGAAWVTVSDARLKKDITPFSEGLDKLLRINPVRFKYKNVDGAYGCTKEQVGVLAQQIKPIFPYMIDAVKGKINPDDEEETELLTMNSSALPFVIINAIKELNNRLESLEKSSTNSNS